MPENSQTFNVIVDFIAKNKDLMEKAKKGAVELTKEQAASIDALHRLKRADEEQTKTFLRNNQLKIAALNAQAAVITKTADNLRRSADDIDRFAKPLFAGGAFLVGGIFAATNKYVADAKEATATTIAWKEAQDSLNQSGLKIGEVLATQALPLLIKAAELTAKVATFIEKNPEIVKAGLNAGLVALTLGAIGKAVSGGIRLYADLKMDAALTLQFTAAQMQLKAAQAQLAASGASKGIGVGATAATGAGGLSVGGFVGIAAASAAFTLALSVGFAKLVESLTGVELPILKVIKYLRGLGDESEQSAAAATAGLEQEKAADQAAREIRQQEREARLAYAQEMLQETITLLANEKLEKIRGLQSFFSAESQLRRQAMVNGLNDLGRNLNAEITMRRQAFQTILSQAADLFRNTWNTIQSFLGLSSSASSIGTASGGSTTTTGGTAGGGTASSTWSLANLFGTRDEGGYTNKGIYRMAWNGNPEFVLSGASTKAMEKMVGGKLTQENIMQSRGGGMTLYDNRRFSGEYTNSMRREVNRDTEQTIGRVLKGAL